LVQIYESILLPRLCNNNKKKKKRRALKLGNFFSRAVCKIRRIFWDSVRDAKLFSPVQASAVLS
jgi:hypothetical protein